MHLRVVVLFGVTCCFSWLVEVMRTPKFGIAVTIAVRHGTVVLLLQAHTPSLHEPTPT